MATLAQFLAIVGFAFGVAMIGNMLLAWAIGVPPADTVIVRRLFK